MAAIPCTLLVDDDVITNFLNEALLRRLAVTDTVLVAGNGQEALDLLQTHCQPPSAPTCAALILLDMKMPVMNGLEFMAVYRRQSPAPAAVVIMLTTSLHPRDVEQMQRLSIAGYLTKPLTPEKIQQVLHLLHIPGVERGGEHDDHGRRPRAFPP